MCEIGRVEDDKWGERREVGSFSDTGILEKRDEIHASLLAGNRNRDRLINLEVIVLRGIETSIGQCISLPDT